MVHKTKELLKTFNSEQKIIEYTRKEESKSLFELFFETIPDATMVISHNEFELFNCNHEFELLTGYSN